MIAAECNFCQWRTKATGVWMARRFSLEHLKNYHPDQYERMMVEVNLIRSLQELGLRSYGQAFTAVCH